MGNERTRVGCMKQVDNNEANVERKYKKIQKKILLLFFILFFASIHLSKRKYYTFCHETKITIETVLCMEVLKRWGFVRKRRWNNNLSTRTQQHCSWLYYQPNSVLTARFVYVVTRWQMSAKFVLAIRLLLCWTFVTSFKGFRVEISAA